MSTTPDIASELLERLAVVAENLPETLRTDHPLQGQTFDGLTSGLNEIARGLFAVADAIKLTRRIDQ